MFKRIIENKKIILWFLFVSIVPFVVSVSDIYFGRIAFWYDPARDFLLALQNLKSPTLIGQPSGLPGLFYGPYWIWTISLLTLISKDPRIVVFFLLTIPYFTVFPFMLYRISKSWGLFVFFSMWLLFILNFGSYANQIWNVHYGALFLITSIYLFINPENKKYFRDLNPLFLGVSVGLIANFHLSFGIPAAFAFIFSLVILHIYENRNKLVESLGHLFKKIVLLIIGICLSFMPFLFFELRHNFIQSRTFIKAITNSVVYNTASVGQTGMSDMEILSSFFGKFSDLLGTQNMVSVLIFGIAVVLILILHLKKKITFKSFEIRLLILIFTISFFLLLSFIFNENPTWGYYFIGVEILFLLFTGLFINKLSLGKYIIIFFLLLAVLSKGEDFKKIFQANNHINSDLGTRSYVVKSIFNDSDKDFQYIAYSSAIYTYEYDYLFSWKDGENIINIKPSSNLVYLIIPDVSRKIEEDFINYKTPIKEYTVLKKWDIPDGTTVYKMIKK